MNESTNGYGVSPLARIAEMIDTVETINRARWHQFRNAALPLPDEILRNIERQAQNKGKVAS